MSARYITKVYFEDLQDNSHPYNVGDVYPRNGYTPSEDRIKELSTTSNVRGIVLIEKEKPVKKAWKDSEE